MMLMFIFKLLLLIVLMVASGYLAGVNDAYAGLRYPVLYIAIGFFFFKMIMQNVFRGIRQ